MMNSMVCSPFSSLSSISSRSLRLKMDLFPSRSSSRRSTTSTWARRLSFFARSDRVSRRYLPLSARLNASRDGVADPSTSPAPAMEARFSATSLAW